MHFAHFVEVSYLSGRGCCGKGEKNLRVQIVNKLWMSDLKHRKFNYVIDRELKMFLLQNIGEQNMSKL